MPKSIIVEGKTSRRSNRERFKRIKSYKKYGRNKSIRRRKEKKLL